MNLLITIGLACCSAAVPDRELLDQHDPVWEVPPINWLDGIPLANGHIGALVWGTGQPLRVTLDKYDAWERREYILTDRDPTTSTVIRAAPGCRCLTTVR
ncbi:MAG: hypothetical protein A2W31_17795 [Planctomycetes bacterium RBG_16_64_10]|nr:MAG: hypothetical protein A2W31_17795 [Planctomycetes bacterium RBG_16_64_10]